MVMVKTGGCSPGTDSALRKAPSATAWNFAFALCPSNSISTVAARTGSWVSWRCDEHGELAAGERGHHSRQDKSS
jgi:hypothetical protein